MRLTDDELDRIATERRERLAVALAARLVAVGRPTPPIHLGEVG